LLAHKARVISIQQAEFYKAEVGKAGANLSKSGTMKSKPRLILVVAGILWLSVVGFGLHKIWRYENDPGISLSAPAQWPADSQISPAHSQATLVMFAHPQCPCTRASVGELALLMANCQGRLTAYVLFFKPKDFPADWEKTDLWHSAAAIPGVSVLQDEDGLEARRFHGATSGHTLLYDAEGQLLFSGGITASRGHSGDNVGRSAIISLLTEGKAEQKETFTFGCSLYDATSECGEGAKQCDK
jgi:hypothetical protein